MPAPEIDGFEYCSQGRHYHRANQVITLAQHAESVERELTGHVGSPTVLHDDSHDGGLVRFGWDGEGGTAACQIACDVRAGQAAAFDGWSATVGLNYLVAPDLTVTGERATFGGGNGNPADSKGLPPRSDTELGEGIVVGVVDTGIYPHEWLDGAYLATPGDREHLNDNDDLLIDSFAGHGTMIAGLVLQQAPGATIRVARTLSSEGVADSAQVAAAIKRLALAGVDILNLSLGCFTHDDQPPPEFEYALSLLSPGTAVVCAAGNHDPKHPPKATARPLFPAAMPRAIGVGALGPDDGDTPTVADFSAKAPWIDAWAQGVDLTSTYVPSLGERDTWATWSGTSFATPVVAGAIGAHMKNRMGPAATIAAAELLAEAAVGSGSTLGPVVHPSKLS